MGIGQAVRSRLGRLETPAAELYRAAFIDLDDLAAQLLAIAPSASRFLEIGCGDGAVADRISRVYPSAGYLGIDVAPTAGRRYRGDRDRASFRVMRSTELVQEHPEPFDVVLVVDVLHHVPDVDDRVELLRDASALTAPGGVLLVKDWERHAGVSHYMTFFADRYISGDKTVDFMTRNELTDLIARALPDWDVQETRRVRPHRANVLHVLSR